MSLSFVLGDRGELQQPTTPSSSVCVAAWFVPIETQACALLTQLLLLLLLAALLLASLTRKNVTGICMSCGWIPLLAPLGAIGWPPLWPLVAFTNDAIFTGSYGSVGDAIHGSGKRR